MDNDVPPRGERDGGQPLAYPLRPGRRTLNENRYIRPERCPEGHELPERKPAVPELVQHQERRGRIRAPAAEARSQGDALANSKAGTEPRAGGVLQSAGGPHREIGLGCEVLRASGRSIRPSSRTLISSVSVRSM